MRYGQLTAAAAVLILLAVSAIALAQPTPTVAVHDRELSFKSATHECKSGHRVELRYVTLDSGAVQYALQYTGCVDESHGILRPSSEGNFGMPQPFTGNFYWSGFMRVFINGTDALQNPVDDWRVLETGPRGSFQVIFAHPDAEVSMRFLLMPHGNHLLADLKWTPRADAEIKTVAIELRCYPSFFTAARKRDGDRHCKTPRTDAGQGKTLALVPGEDTYLYYYDTVFDVANGEGDGPCAILAPPEGLIGGKVVVGSYPVTTTLDCDPAAGGVRLGLYDFSGKTNAQAAEYLEQHAQADIEELTTVDFRPLSLVGLDLDALAEEATRLLADAGEDGIPYQKKVEDLLARLTELSARAEGGDLRAEADLAAALLEPADMFWKLRAFAILNNPDR